MTRKKRVNFIAIFMLVFAFVITSFILAFDNLNTSNAYNGGVPTPIGSLTLSDYATRSDGLIFDSSVLQKLYGKLTGKTTDTYENAKKAIASNKTSVTSRSMTITHNKSKNYKDLGSIVVEFGGLKWNVVFATTDTNSASAASSVSTGIGTAGDLIVTLWLSEVDSRLTTNPQWSHFTDSSTSGSYASCEYSMSKVRVSTLNGGGVGNVSTRYATSISTLSSQISSTSRAGNIYAPFTMTNAAIGNNATNKGKSLVNFLASPRQVNYQKTENWVWSFNHSFNTPFLMPNEAWGNGTDGINGPDISIKCNGSGGWYAADNINDWNIIDNSNYYNWADDYLWLPSMTETGFDNTNHPGADDNSYGVSLWGIPNSDKILTSSDTVLLRTSHCQPTLMWGLDSYGAGDLSNINASHAIRPALHLNLTKAQENVSINVPSDFSVEYDGNAKGIENADWYTTAIGQQFSSDIKYYSSENPGGTTTKPTNQGTYQIGLKPSSGRTWTDGSTGEKKITMTINKKQLAAPTLKSVSEMYSKRGSTFNLLSFDHNIMDIEIPDDYKGVDKDLSINQIYAQDVGDYQLTVTLTNSNYEWQSGSNPMLSFAVTPAPINITVEDVVGGKLYGFADGTLDIRFSISAQVTVFDNQSVNLNVIAKNKTNGVERVLGNSVITHSDTYATVTATFGRGYEVGDRYELLIKTDSADMLPNDSGINYGKNYEVKQQNPVELEILDASNTRLSWSLMEEGSSGPIGRQDADINDGEIDFSGKELRFNGKKYYFTVELPSSYTKIGDVTVERLDGDAFTTANMGRYAAKYKTSVTVSDGATQKTCSIIWEIKPYIFDLSAVKWINEIEYTGSPVSPKLEGAVLADMQNAGIQIVYDGVKSSTNVTGEDLSISVSFAYLDENEPSNKNYTLPKSGSENRNTYIFNGSGEFAWNSTWKVVPALISTQNRSDWDEIEVTDINNNTFKVLVLKNPNLKDIVNYLYYPCNSNGTIDSSKEPLTAEEILLSATDEQYFKAYPTIVDGYASNYKFESTDGDKRYSPMFTVGGGASGVTVALDKNSIEYTGKPVNLKVNITGAATLNQLTLTYYTGDIVDDTHKFDGVPTNVGKYMVVITSNTPTVLLGGTTQFEFEITKNVISTTWNENAKPPVLTLKYGQLGAIEYIIVDSNNNPVANIEDIVPGEYAIKAKIKDSAIANYIFDDDTVETAYKTFTVRDGDSLFDPSSPENPFNPKDPDAEDPTPPGEGGGNVLDKIKEFFDKLIASGFPLWQVATMAVAGLLTLIFLIKTIQYGNRKKKAKGEAKKLNAKTFAALAPIFATDVAYAGLTNKIWSIMAFSFAALALVMFVVALITRSAWKKAELAKEAAAEDLEQRKLEAQEAKQLAREEAQVQRQRELQETLSQVTLGGQVGDGSIVLIEEMRREMEARHREEMDALREEQAKRDEAMKLMLANLMGRAQASDDDMTFASVDDTDLIADKVFARLLPAVQQMMPDNTAYLTAPGYEDSEELKNLVEEQKSLVEEQKAIVEEQNEQMRSMSEQISELQNQIADMSQGRVEAELLPDNTEEIKALTDKITELQNRLENPTETVVTADNSEEIKALTAQIAELQEQIANPADSSEEMKAMAAEMSEMRNQLTLLAQGNTTTVYVEKESEDDDVDDEEEWDSILDEDDDEFVEAVVIEEDGTVKKTSPNFRMRLKQSSDKNREWYTVIKNMFCSQKGVTYRVYKRVEKIRYQGQVVAVIGIAKRSIKLWLALKPYEYDARRYHHKDVSDKPRFVDVPMYVRVGSDRALARAQELILALFQELNMEARKRYNDRSIQELIFTLKHNRLLTNKQNKQLLCEVMHVHDCDVLDDETAEKCIETKNVDFIDNSVIETVKLDDIDANFQDGNRVTLEKLKKVGLVSENCTGYNVVADKRLTKPLIVVANDFTLTAVKLITLTGGRAIKLQQV